MNAGQVGQEVTPSRRGSAAVRHQSAVHVHGGESGQSDQLALGGAASPGRPDLSRAADRPALRARSGAPATHGCRGSGGRFIAASGHLRQIQRHRVCAPFMRVFIARNALRFLPGGRAHCFCPMPARLAQCTGGVRSHMMATRAALCARTGPVRSLFGSVDVAWLCDVSQHAASPPVPRRASAKGQGAQRRCPCERTVTRVRQRMPGAGTRRMPRIPC